MKSKRLIISSCIGLAALFTLHNSYAADAKKPTTEKEKFSYAIGFQIGQGFKRDGLEIDINTMSQAIADVIDDKAPQLSIPEMRTAMDNAQKALMAKRAEQGKKAKDAGEAYLAANKKKEGVITRDSGIQYKVIKSGTGKQPTADSTITAHYEGTLTSGRVFDSSYKRGEPATFGVNQVIPGWQEILPLMKEGDKWQVFIPSDLAYGERGSGANIGPNETLIFEIELIKVN